MARRNHGIGALSEESWKPSHSDRILSMEEMGILIDDAAQSAQNIETESDQADKIIEIAQNLENLTNKAAEKGELTDDEAAMMESAGDMAVAGTDHSPESIVPSLEAYREDGKVNFKLALEDFRTIIRNSWASVKRLIAKIWKWIKDFFYKIVGTVPTLKRRLTSLKERARASAGKNREEAKFEIANTSALHIGKGPAKTFETFHGGLKVISKLSESIFVDYAGDLKKFGTKISEALSDFDPSAPEREVDKLVKSLSSEAHHGIAGLHRSMSDKRWAGYETKASDDMLGGKVVMLSWPKDSESGADGTLGEINAIRRMMITVEDSNDGTRDQAGNIEFSTLTQSECEKVIEECQHILDRVEEFERGKLKRELSETAAKIERAGEKAENAIAKIRAGDDNAEERKAVPYYRGLIEMAAWHARQVSQPSVAFSRNAIRSVQMAITIVEKSLNQYK